MLGPCTCSLRTGCDVSQLLALRAAVLRRAASQLMVGELRVRSSVLNTEASPYPAIGEPLQRDWVALCLPSTTQNKGMLMVTNAQRPNPSIEGTSTSGLRPLAAAPHVKR